MLFEGDAPSVTFIVQCCGGADDGKGKDEKWREVCTCVGTSDIEKRGFPLTRPTVNACGLLANGKGD